MARRFKWEGDYGRPADVPSDFCPGSQMLPPDENAAWDRPGTRQRCPVCGRRLLPTGVRTPHELIRFAMPPHKPRPKHRSKEQFARLHRKVEELRKRAEVKYYRRRDRWKNRSRVNGRILPRLRDYV